MNVGRPLLAFGILVASSGALSFLHPWGNLRAVPRNDAIMGGANVPTNVRLILQNKCADCHSNNTHWPSYSRFAPGSWLMEHDVHDAREHLNFSTWSQIDADARIDLLAKIATQSRKGEMPIKQYVWIHPSARLTDDERRLLSTWARTERNRLRNETPQR
ncbi:MAG: heme-binding domain-containing protein [Acidobacteriaceae bacterium]|nr:heme-binding domain-containing protein [Acidobacteriaceae bacterium]